MFSKFDRPTRAVIDGVLDVAWLALSTDRWTAARVADTTARVRAQVLAAVEAGDRTAARLVQAALQGIKR